MRRSLALGALCFSAPISSGLVTPSLPALPHLTHLVSTTALGLLLLLQPQPQLPTTQCVEDVNPSRTIVTCRQLGLVEGRLRGCLANENCFSTSSKTATKKAQPWFYSQTSSADAFTILKDAVQLEGLTVLRATPAELYILAAEKDVPKQPAGASLFYEFLIRPDDHAVLYRALVDKTVFVYPLQQPVADFGALQQRLAAVFSRTGFSKDDTSYEEEPYRSPFFFQ